MATALLEHQLGAKQLDVAAACLYTAVSAMIDANAGHTYGLTHGGYRIPDRLPDAFFRAFQTPGLMDVLDADWPTALDDAVRVLTPAKLQPLDLAEGVLPAVQRLLQQAEVQLEASSEVGWETVVTLAESLGTTSPDADAARMLQRTSVWQKLLVLATLMSRQLADACKARRDAGCDDGNLAAASAALENVAPLLRSLSCLERFQWSSVQPLPLQLRSGQERLIRGAAVNVMCAAKAAAYVAKSTQSRPSQLLAEGLYAAAASLPIWADVHLLDSTELSTLLAALLPSIADLTVLQQLPAVLLAFMLQTVTLQSSRRSQFDKQPCERLRCAAVALRTLVAADVRRMRELLASQTVKGQIIAPRWPPACQRLLQSAVLQRPASTCARQAVQELDALICGSQLAAQPNAHDAAVAAADAAAAALLQVKLLVRFCFTPALLGHVNSNAPGGIGISRPSY